MACRTYSFWVLLCFVVGCGFPAPKVTNKDANDSDARPAPGSSCTKIDCTPVGEPCGGSGNMFCCAGATCDNGTKLCTYPSSLCRPQGAGCSSPTDCCGLSCVNGQCSASCYAYGEACTKDSDCCAGKCGVGAASICSAADSTCTTLGNCCTNDGQCCSQNCQGGRCAPTSNCSAIGDICYGDTDCCSSYCIRSSSTAAGYCGDTGVSLKTVGEPCAACNDCVSYLCAPTLTGGKACSRATGCLLTGEPCNTSDDCCGGVNAAGTGTATCDVHTASPVKTCGHSAGAIPPGNTCRYIGASPLCVNNLPANCEGNCTAGNGFCCQPDTNGIPRCMGGSSAGCPNGYTGVSPCCIALGNSCSFSAQCCNGSACLPDGSGVLHCGNGCSNINGGCRADGDCCVGLACVVPHGATNGTCSAPSSCPLPGQTCSATNPCCAGLSCQRAFGGSCRTTDPICSCWAL